jgi:hypothetical protein
MTQQTWVELYAAHDPGTTNTEMTSTDASVQAWNESYRLTSYTNMWHATKDNSYLDKAVYNIDAIFAAAAKNTDTLLPGWGWTSANYSTNKVPYSYIVSDGMILTAIAEYVRCVLTNQPLLQSYKAKADYYLGILISKFASRWDFCYQTERAALLDFTDDIGFFVMAKWCTGYAGLPPGISLPFNQSNAFARFLLKLYAVTGNNDYLTKAVQIANTMKFKALKPTAGGVLWNFAADLLSTDGTRYMPVSDVSHSNVDASFILEMYEHGNVFTQTTIDEIKYQLLNVIWDKTKNVSHVFMDGTDQDSTIEIDNLTGYALFGADPAVAAAIWSMMSNPASKCNGPMMALTIANLAMSSKTAGPT